MLISKRSFIMLFFAAILLATCSQENTEMSTKDKLLAWRQGVWITGTGTFTVYTDSHYFVLSFEGDTANANLYYGASQLSYHNGGIARHQVMRFRAFPGREADIWKKAIFEENHTEIPLIPDTTLFNPKQCVIEKGVIYDAVIEATDEYILLMTCNGDNEKIFNDGRSAYMPATGGEYFSYRVEEFK